MKNVTKDDNIVQTRSKPDITPVAGHLGILTRDFKALSYFSRNSKDRREIEGSNMIIAIVLGKGATP